MKEDIEPYPEYKDKLNSISAEMYSEANKLLSKVKLPNVLKGYVVVGGNKDK